MPYRQAYNHNVWGETIWRDAAYWSTSDSFTAVFTNGRRSGYQYDAAGHLLNDTTNTYVYDAVGQNYSVQSLPPYQVHSTQWLDGDGLTVKRNSSMVGTYYYLRSSALGGKVVTEIHGDTMGGTYGWTLGSKAKGYVYAGGSVMAEQTSYYYNGSPNESVKWVHNDPHTGSEVSSWTGGIAYLEHEIDPLGVDTGFEDPANNPPPVPDPATPSYVGGEGSNLFGPKCSLDGILVDCNFVYELVEGGSAVHAPSQTTIPVVYRGKQTFAYFQAFADGYQGFVPATAQYTRNGQFSPFSKPDRPSLYVRPAGAPRDTDFAALNGATDEALLKKEVGAFPATARSNQGNEIKIGPEEIKLARNALYWAIEALKLPNCKKIIGRVGGPPYGPDPYNALVKMAERGNITLTGGDVYYSGGVAVAVTTVGQHENSKMQLGRLFILGQPRAESQYGISRQLWRIYLILHETAHATGKLLASHDLGSGEYDPEYYLFTYFDTEIILNCVLPIYISNSKKSKPSVTPRRKR